MQDNSVWPKNTFLVKLLNKTYVVALVGTQKKHPKQMFRPMETKILSIPWSKVLFLAARYKNDFGYE